MEKQHRKSVLQLFDSKISSDYIKTDYFFPKSSAITIYCANSECNAPKKRFTIKNTPGNFKIVKMTPELLQYKVTCPFCKTINLVTFYFGSRMQKKRDNLEKEFPVPVSPRKKTMKAVVYEKGKQNESSDSSFFPIAIDKKPGVIRGRLLE